MAAEVTYCTTTEIASRFAVDTSTVRRWVSKGQLKPAFTTPGGHHRFLLADVERLMTAAAA